VDPSPTFAHAVEAFLTAHSRAGAWSPGTAVKYRQTLTGLGARLAAAPVAASTAALDTPAGAAALQEAFTTAYGGLAPPPGPGTSPHYRESGTNWGRSRGQCLPIRGVGEGGNSMNLGMTGENLLWAVQRIGLGNDLVFVGDDAEQAFTVQQTADGNWECSIRSEGKKKITTCSLQSPLPATTCWVSSLIPSFVATK